MEHHAEMNITMKKIMIASKKLGTKEPSDLQTPTIISIK